MFWHDDHTQDSLSNEADSEAGVPYGPVILSAFIKIVRLATFAHSSFLGRAPARLRLVRLVAGSQCTVTRQARRRLASLPPHLHIDNGPLSGALIKTRAPPTPPTPLHPTPTAHTGRGGAGSGPKLRTPLRWPTTTRE